MTSDTEHKIEQREAMIRRHEQTIAAAKKSADEATDERSKAPHLSQATLRTQRVEDLKKQILDLKGNPNPE